MFFSLLFYVFVFLLFLKLATKFFSARCNSKVCLVGKTAIVTGGAAGLGFQIALGLASRGCKVIIADCDDSRAVKEKLVKWTRNPNIITKHIDLASFKSIRKFAKEINETEERLDILVNNAGVSRAGYKRTEDNLHIGMQINHFGPFLLTHLLIDLLKKSAPSRIIWMSSLSSFINNLQYETLNPPEEGKQVLSELSIYVNSKFCNMITAKIFGEKLKGSGVTSNSCCPGVTRTNILRRFKSESTFSSLQLVLQNLLYMYPLGKEPREAVETPLYLALSNKMENKTGGFYTACKEFYMPSKANDKEFCEKIWKMSEELTGISSSDYLKDYD